MKILYKVNVCTVSGHLDLKLHENKMCTAVNDMQNKEECAVKRLEMAFVFHQAGPHHCLIAYK